MNKLLYVENITANESPTPRDQVTFILTKSTNIMIYISV